jgi:hypothetical protein
MNPDEEVLAKIELAPDARFGERARQVGKLEREGCLGTESQVGHRRHAVGQLPGSHAGFGGQGHERRGREGAPTVFGEKPEGVET